MITVLLVGASYLIGSIPLAWLIAKAVTGQDLREMGTGNVGVMNTGVSVARWAGLAVFLGEIGKGAMAVFMARTLSDHEASAYLAVLAAVTGTRRSIWLDGAGGRGNTSAMAGFVLISWRSVLITGLIWLATRLLTRSSFVAMRVTLAALPIVFGLVARSFWAFLFSAAFSLLFVTTHRPETDDHLAIKSGWSSLGAFLTSPRRK